MLPVGTVTFLFTDIEGSTRLLQQAGGAYAAMLDDHRRLLRAAFADHAGHEVDTQGDSFFVAFGTPRQAVTAAAEAQVTLARHAWPPPFAVRVRMGVHTGEVSLVDGSYVGVTVHRAARIAGAGHGGQTLLSDATAALVRDELPAGAALRDLGEHRLKDFPTPARLYQLDLPGLPTTFPPLRAAAPRRSDLPLLPGGTVGRDGEVAALVALLADPATRLVTLTGPGGIGKTRLAVEGARAAARAAPGGVVFVPLAAVTDPSLVLGAIADAVGARREPGSDAVADVGTALAGERTLLVLDNLEQVVDAAADLAELVDRVPAAVVLVTSRVPLRLRAERQFPVGALAEADAVRLFTERATSVRPAFSADGDDAGAVAELVRRLDGLPLAIELAAARVGVLPPRALLSRLGRRLDVLGSGPVDLPRRQRTLKATVDWSHDLLRPHEQALFARLAVFSGGWDLEAAERIGGRTGEPDVLDTLSALVDASLVVRDDAAEPWFSMLETVRVHAAERLSASPDRQETTRRHTDWVLSLAAELPRARGAAYRLTRDRLDRALPELRAAVQRLLDDGDVASVGLLIRDAATYLRFRGLETEATTWVDAALARSDGAPPAVRGRLLVSRAVLASVLGDSASVPALLEEGEALLPEDEDHELDRALAAIPGIQVRTRLGIREGARSAEEGLARFAALGMEVGQAIMHLVSGDLALVMGDVDDAVTHYRSVIALSETLGEGAMLGRALSMLGLSLLERGDVEAAGRSLIDGARANRRTGRPTSMAFSLEGLAALALARGRPALAARNLAVAAAARGSLALPLQEAVVPLVERLTGRARQLLGDQAFDRETREARRSSLPEALDRALEELAEA